ncbi:MULTISPECIES: hypothetical protein [Hyphobacterium]|uniref:Uncharacterized protein n=1 Tax=Hyphobacterium vulgare TaxID=1736751 RepID=A0ABV7A1E4_9PROT
MTAAFKEGHAAWQPANGGLFTLSAGEGIGVIFGPSTWSSFRPRINVRGKLQRESRASVKLDPGFRRGDG